MKKIILFTESLSNDPCDCVWQTAMQLEKKGFSVQILWMSERLSLFSNQRPRKRFVKHIHNIYVYKILPFERFEIVKHANTSLNLFCRLLFNRLKEDHPNIYWIFEPFSFQKFEFLFRGMKIYDRVDNFSSLSTDLKKREESLFSFVDRIFVCNQSLFNQLKHVKGKVTQVEQGFAHEVFNQQKNTLKEKKFVRKPIQFIFNGTICTRIDFPLLNSIVEARENDIFTIVGPIVKDFQPTKTFQADVDHLFGYKNVKYLGVQSRDTVAKLIKNSDIGLIPYDIRSEFNLFSLPLKTLEYFYFGVPVLATPTPEMKNLGKLILTFKNQKEFISQVNHLVLHGWDESKRLAQREFSMSQTWEKKINHIFEML